MKPVLCIPSYQRPKGKAIQRCKDLKLEKFIFIRKSEYELYKQWESYYTLVTQKDSSADDIGKVRRNIVDYCNRHSYDWAFIFDDDITKVELLGEKPDGTMTAQRIIDGSQTPPGFEYDALKFWYRMAKQYSLSLSSPNYRAYRRDHGYLILNRSAIIQCVLAHIPDIIAVGNYKSIRITGNEDYYIQYKLMEQAYNTGKIGLIEYNCPNVGTGTGGCNCSENSDIVERYTNYVDTFLSSTCNDPNLIGIKTMRNGAPSIKFVWSGWEQYIESKYIPLKRKENCNET